MRFSRLFCIVLLLSTLPLPRLWAQMPTKPENPVVPPAQLPTIPNPPAETDKLSVPILPPHNSENPTDKLTLRPDFRQDSTHEVRALWVVRDSLTNRAAIRRIVAQAKRYRFNTLFVQVRGRGDAYYKSNIEPRAEELSGKSLSFDPLAAIIDDGHRAGLQIHAWMNCCLVWHKGRRPYSSLHVVNRHPEWLVCDTNGRTLFCECGDSEGAFLNPAVPAVRDYLAALYGDVASRYSVDGIHLDYVRLPGSNYSCSDFDMTTFREWALPYAPADVAAYADTRLRAGSRLAWRYTFPNLWQRWRAENVTLTVRAIRNAIRHASPRVALTAAVFPSYKVAYQDKGQAWQEWVQTDLVDGVALMAYNPSTETVARQVRDAVVNCDGRKVIVGLGAWRLSSKSAVVKAKICRQLGVAGLNFFSYGEITHSGRSEAYLDALCTALFAKKATAPDWRGSVETAWLSFSR